MDAYGVGMCRLHIAAAVGYRVTMFSRAGEAVHIHRVCHSRDDQHPVAVDVAQVTARLSAAYGEVVQAEHILVVRDAVHRHIFGGCGHQEGVFVPLGDGRDGVAVQGNEAVGIRVRHRIGRYEFLVCKPVGEAAGEEREGEWLGEVQLRAYNPVVVGDVRMEWASEKPVARVCRGVVLVPGEEVVVQHHKGHGRAQVGEIQDAEGGGGRPVAGDFPTILQAGAFPRKRREIAGLPILRNRMRNHLSRHRHDQNSQNENY